ncbi:MAG: hypothetical protein Q8L48_04735 [Archangium sp.]|nr:hypothetical protein [Archangium sp.]
MRHVVLIAFSSLLLVTSGCKTQCRLLSEKLCDCTTNSSDKTNCLSNVATRDGTYVATEETEARCEALAPTCDCRLVDTQAGKERCGLAVSGDAGI